MFKFYNFNYWSFIRWRYILTGTGGEYDSSNPRLNHYLFNLFKIILTLSCTPTLSLPSVYAHVQVKSKLSDFLHLIKSNLSVRGCDNQKEKQYCLDDHLKWEKKKLNKNILTWHFTYINISLKIDIKPSVKREGHSTCGKIGDEVGHLRKWWNIILMCCKYVWFITK